MTTVTYLPHAAAGERFAPPAAPLPMPKQTLEPQFRLGLRLRALLRRRARRRLAA